MSPDELSDELLQYLDHPDLDLQLQKFSPQFSHELVLKLGTLSYEEQFHNSQRALQIADLSAKIARYINDPKTTGVALWNLGNVHLAQNNYSKSNQFFLEAEQSYEAMNELLMVAGLRINRIGNYCGMGQYEEALALSDSARELCINIGEEAEIYLGNLEMTLGWVYEETGEFKKAVDVYENGRLLFQKHEQPLQVSLIEQNLAHLNLITDNFEEAEALLLSARKTFFDGDYLRELARADLNLGDLAFKLGHFQQALQYFEASYTAFASIPIPVEMAYVNIKRSTIYLQLNLFREAIELADEAMKICRQQKMKREYVSCLLNQGIGYLKLGNVEFAENLFGRARRHAHAQNAPLRLFDIDLRRAELALKSARYKRSKRIILRLLKTSSDVLVPNLEVKARLLLAQTELEFESPDFSLVSAQLNRSLVVCRDKHLKQLSAESLTTLGDLFLAKSDWQSARENYQKAVDEIAQLKSLFSIDELHIGYLDAQQRIYQKLISSVHLMQQQNHETLDDLILVLNDAQVAGVPLLSRSEPSDLNQLHKLQELWNWYQNKLNAPDTNNVETLEIESKLKELEIKIGELHRQIQLKSSSTLIGFPSNSKKVHENSINQVQMQLEERQAIVQFYEAEAMLNAIVVTKGGKLWIPQIISLSMIQRQKQAWLFFLNNALQTGAQPMMAEAHLQRFHHTLLRPLESALDNIVHLSLIVPPNWQELPFAAFFDGNQFLIEKTSLSYLSSLEQFFSGSQKLKSNSVTVVGHSDNGRLPNAILEATAVSEILSANWRVKNLHEGEATVEAIQRAVVKNGIVHIAAHAVFRPDNPMFSWIQFADKRLTMADIYHWSLQKRPLIVLSACETGQGAARGGGLMGLSRSFQSAGAGELIMSQWRLEDSNSAEIMKNFYDAFLQSETPDSSLSLQAAQKMAIKSKISPIFWAGYVHLRC